MAQQPMRRHECVIPLGDDARREDRLVAVAATRDIVRAARGTHGLLLLLLLFVDWLMILVIELLLLLLLLLVYHGLPITGQRVALQEASGSRPLGWDIEAYALAILGLSLEELIHRRRLVEQIAVVVGRTVLLLQRIGWRRLVNWQMNNCLDNCFYRGAVALLWLVWTALVVRRLLLDGRCLDDLCRFSRARCSRAQLDLVAG